MTFAPIALTDIPAVVVGAKSKPISAEDMATADAIAAIVATGNGARSGDTYETREKAETAGRKVAALVNKAGPALAEGLVYRFRTLADGEAFTFVIISGTAPKPRGPRKAKTPAKTPAETPAETPATK